jgi:Zn-finger nucleic acid-binding protein
VSNIEDNSVKNNIADDPYLRCPKCLSTLDQVFFLEIPIDRCPKCEGVWLDAGELELVVERERAREGNWFSKMLGRFDKP